MFMHWLRFDAFVSSTSEQANSTRFDILNEQNEILRWHSMAHKRLTNEFWIVWEWRSIVIWCVLYPASVCMRASISMELLWISFVKIHSRHATKFMLASLCAHTLPFFVEFNSLGCDSACISQCFFLYFFHCTETCLHCLFMESLFLMTVIRWYRISLSTAFNYKCIFCKTFAGVNFRLYALLANVCGFGIA